MPTSPLSDELVAKLKGATAWRFTSELGPVFTTRFFCCGSPNEMGLAEGKDPVAVLSLEPNPAFVGDTVAFDGTDSYDPDGTVTVWAWTFASGTPASSTADSGTVSWAAAGEYEVTLVVTDGTGLKSSPARVTMVVKEAAGAYFIGTTTGVYYTDDGGQTWTARNTGLGGDALTVGDLKIDPATQALPDASKTIWIATADGLYVSNNGGGSWVKKNPASVSNTWADDPAPAVDDLAFSLLQFAGDRLFAAGEWQNGDSEWRGWLFYTDDAPAMRTSTAGTVSWSEVV